MIYELNDRHGSVQLITPCSFFGINFMHQYMILWYRAYGAKWCQGDEQVIKLQPFELIGMKKYKSLEEYLTEHFEEFL